MPSSLKKTIYGVFEKDHKTTFESIERFYGLIERLRYEGKSSRGKNLAEAEKAVAHFSSALIGHMREEERVFFPFIRRHIPRLESMVCQLVAEHEDFRKCLKDLKTSLKACRRGYSADAVNTLCERGTYLVCFLRSHMWCESHSLYKAADDELKPDEKKCLIRMAEDGR